MGGATAGVDAQGAGGGGAGRRARGKAGARGVARGAGAAPFVLVPSPIAPPATAILMRRASTEINHDD